MLIIFFFTKLMKYEYDESMNESYERSLVKSFKKTVDDGLFNFIIVDMINNKIDKLDEMSTYAKTRAGFHVFVIELIQDSQTCYNRCVHNRSINEIKKVLYMFTVSLLLAVLLNMFLFLFKIIDEWEDLPATFTKLDVNFFLQDQEIENVII
jgi:sugar-specific transcriptional regulator TrmB